MIKDEKLRKWARLEPTVSFKSSSLIFDTTYDIKSDDMVKLDKSDFVRYLQFSKKYHEAMRTVGTWEIKDPITGELDEKKYIKLVEERQ